MNYEKMWIKLMKKLTSDARWVENTRMYACEILEKMAELQIEELGVNDNE